MLIFAIPIALVSFGILFLETKAQRKRNNLNKAVEFCTTNLKSNAKESIAIGGGATALTLLDIYEACDNHSEVLDVLEDRYNRTMGPNSSPFEWHEKIQELFSKGDKSVGAYVSGFAGQAGENATVKMFEAQGLKAELFESRTHPNDDVRVFDSNGSYTDYSVKSYEDVSDFKRVVMDHPESSNYVINSELFEKLENNGTLEEFNDKGIKILDGGFSHELNTEFAEETFEDIYDSSDLSDDIPVIATVLFGYKTIKNFSKLCDGKQSNYEFGVNVVGDIVKIGTAGVFATGGAKAGAAIGTMFAPGIGTIIGGGIGAIIGAFGGASLFQWVKERFKWGDIIDAIEYFGRKYSNGFNNEQKDNIKKQILELDNIEKKYEIEKKLSLKYEKSLSPYSFEKFNIASILNFLHIKRLGLTINKIHKSIDKTEMKILSLVRDAAKKTAPNDSDKQNKIRYRLLGEILLSNSSIFLSKSLANNENTLFNGYKKQIKIAPNHPYKLTSNGQELLKGLTYKSLMETEITEDYKYKANYLMWIISILGLLVSSYFIIIS